MNKDQRIVAFGAGSGVAFMILAVSAIYYLWPTSHSLADLSFRIAYALQVNAFAVLPLLIMIIAVGNNRFLSEAIDPTLHKEAPHIQINGRVAENTLQQNFIFLIGTLALCTNLDSEQMKLLPAVAIVFLIARFAFWVGYRIHPLYRAFGMAATGYLNVGILVYAIWLILS